MIADIIAGGVYLDYVPVKSRQLINRLHGGAHGCFNGKYSIVLNLDKLTKKAQIGASLWHAERAIRLAAVQALAEIGSPGAMQGLERTLDDDDREVRLAAVRVLGQRRHRASIGRIETLVQGKDVRSADLTEKMAFFEAYGAMVGEEGVAILDAMLNSGGFLRKREDPEVRACAAMARARVRGFQGRDYSAPDKVMACAKHWVGYGAAEAGRDYNTTDMSERTLREIYLPPFKAAVDEGVGAECGCRGDGHRTSPVPGNVGR